MRIEVDNGRRWKWYKSFFKKIKFITNKIKAYKYNFGLDFWKTNSFSKVFIIGLQYSKILACI